MSDPTSTEDVKEAIKTERLALLLGFLQSKTGTALLVVVWPVLLGLLGLPTGAAKSAITAFEGTATEEVPCVCPPVVEPVPAVPVVSPTVPVVVPTATIPASEPGPAASDLVVPVVPVVPASSTEASPTPSN